jgi:hypothetical protein
MGALSRGVRAGSLFVSLIAAALAGAAAQAAEISWIGGTDELWSTPTNWSPIEIGDPPQMIQRVPAEGDDVLIADATNGFRVFLDADTALLDSLTLSGMRFDASGYLLNVAGATTVEEGHLMISGKYSGEEVTIANGTIHLNSGSLNLMGGIRVLSGEFVARGSVTALDFDFLETDGVEFGPGTRFLLEDGSELDVAGFSFATSVRINSQEIDLDGEHGDVEIDVDGFGSLTVNAPSVDNDIASPGFDGRIRVGAAGLTMNIDGGWELDGVLELSTNSHYGSAQLYGTPITVDGGGPGDGILVRGRDLDNREDITIHTDVVLTENARIAIDEELGFLRITGGLEADGTLEYVKIYEHYHPPVGNSYHLIEAEEGISGRFAALDFFDLPENRSWYVEYGPTSVTAHVIEPLPGDYNASGLVEQADLDLVLGNWGRSADELPAGWVNDLPSGIIDQAELDRVLAGWGDQVILPAGAAAAAVPEPAALTMLLVAIGSACLSHCVPRRPT